MEAPEKLWRNRQKEGEMQNNVSWNKEKSIFKGKSIKY